MATTQEALDLRYDILQAEKEQKLNEIFDQNIISFAKKNNLTTFEEISTLLIELDFDYTKISKIKGVEYLRGLVNLLSVGCNLTELDLTSIRSLNYISLGFNQLINVGNLSQLVNLTNLFLNNNSLEKVGLLNKMVGLVNLNLNDNQLTDVGYLGGLVNLNSCGLARNNFSTGIVDNLLSGAKVAYNVNNSLSVLALEGNAVPTGGANNADYLYLIGQGVTVTIEV